MAEKKEDKRERWYVDFPTYRYNEDVKKIARQKDLKIINARYQGKAEQCKNAPKLTLKKEYQPVEKTEE